MENKQIIIDGVDVSGCCQYMPRYMEDYDIDTLDYCRYHFKPCKDVDVKYCYYKQLVRKEEECEELKETINLQNEMQMEVCEEKNEEIEKLKAEKEEIKKYLGISHKTILERLEELTDFRDGDMEEIDQLKAKNDEYSLFIEKLCDYVGLECDDEEQAMRTLSDFARQMNKAIWIIDRHRQTLAEIKEIAKENIRIADLEGLNGVYRRGLAKQILQKISECEVKDES